MHYAIVAIGSRGDVQPYIALALGLKDRGHQVTILAYQNFKDFVESYGVQFAPLSGNIEQLLHTEEVQKMLKSGSFFKLGLYSRRHTQHTHRQLTHDLLAGCENAEVILTSLLGIAWVYSIAEKTRRKWAIVQVSLPMTPTIEFPAVGIDFFSFPLFNLFSHWIVRYGFWILNKKVINDFRQSVRLPRLSKPIFKKITVDNILSLYCFSPTLLQRPRDWRKHDDITGFLFLPQEKREQSMTDLVPTDFAQWLAEGEKPVYIGFGSIPVPDPELFSRILAEMLTTTTHRFVFCQGWSRLAGLPHHPNLFVVSAVNHDWLFPQCKAVVVHGGIGTVAAAIKAKVPLIILSILYDQPVLGKIVENKKIGIHIPFKKITTGKLVNAIEASQAPDIIKNSIEVGARVNNEDGLSVTIDHLEKYFR